MKRTVKNILLTAIALFLFTGCFLQSVHPLVSEDEAILLNGLEGTWLDGEELWTFAHNPSLVKNYDFNFPNLGFSIEEGDTIESMQYLVVYQDINDHDTSPQLFFGTIGAIGDNYFLDLTPFPISEKNGFMEFHYFPVHTFSKIELAGDELKLSFFKSDWIQEQIQNNRIRIKHEKIQHYEADDTILITAGTKELQKFVKKYASDENALDKPSILTRTYESF